MDVAESSVIHNDVEKGEELRRLGRQLIKNIRDSPAGAEPKENTLNAFAKKDERATTPWFKGTAEGHPGWKTRRCP